MSVCPSCTQQIAGGARVCSWCNASLGADENGWAILADLPPIRPGESILTRSFAFAPLPALDKRDVKLGNSDITEATKQGVLYTALTNFTRWFVQPNLRVRDVCVRLAFDTLDPGVQVLVLARRQAIGAAHVWYELGVRPHDRNFRLGRMFSGDGGVAETSLFGPAAHDAIAPTGDTNNIELRVQGGVIEGHANGVRLAAQHDVALGIGGIAIGVRALAKDQGNRRVLFRSYEIRTVAP
jgi:hypothetical protein